MRKPLQARVLATLILVIAIFLIAHSISRGTSLSKTATKEALRLKNRYTVARERAAQLDGRFLSRLVYQAGNLNSIHSALPSEEGQDSKYSAAIVMGRKKDDVQRTAWVNDKLLNVQQRHIYIVDDTSTSDLHLNRNHGREAIIYMKYILDHYDDLPDITFFWHSDEIVWHNNLLLGWSSVETINRMDRENIMNAGYVPSRCDHWPGCPAWIRFNPSKAEHQLDPHRLEEMFSPELFKRLFPDNTDGDFPPYFAGTCCSQFAVSRDAIRSRPRETYQAILDWIEEYEDDERSGMVMEYTWPYVFRGRGVLCPSMSECYCKTYNFCMANQTEVDALESWNSMRTRREEVKWQVTFAEEAMRKRQRTKEESGASPEEVLAVELAFQPEIERLGTELDSLVNRTWSAREAIIKHWRLPAPPVGW